ncbi:MAG: acyl-CoA dehydrogenase [Proteobacteria bacterium]|nr:acyl-CoA dehydrogenase [Pseudomonadota bacterium]
MAKRFMSERNMKFLLYEVFDCESLTQFNYYKDHNRKMFDLVIKEAVNLGKDLLYPIYEEMDRKPPELVNGEVKVHPKVRSINREFAAGGWMTSRTPYEHGGEQLPAMVAGLCEFIFQCANFSASVYTGLTGGAAHLIETFGSKEQYDTYIPPMRTGTWQGTMALTEPEAGSSLGDISTIAEPADDGYYLIKGQKIFISAGDHDAADNIVHLLLAKIPGSPPGVKGISLFIVPKKRIEPDGSLVANDVVTSGVYHKLGYRGCPIVQLGIGDKNDCRGFLVGEANHGLKYMFQMMNGARIGVGLSATALATAAYYASLEYTQTRKQGRKLDQKDPTKPPVPIIEHADVKRMLLFQKAVSEGSQSLLLLCTKYTDLLLVTTGEEREKYNLLLEVLTPIVKSYPSEMGILSISQGLQCLGGSGFCDDYPLEQYYRDCRIHPIHEGTTGIQGMDLLGRKVLMKNGKAFELYNSELFGTIEKAKRLPELLPLAVELENALTDLQAITGHLVTIAQQQGPESFLADSVLYLELFGIVTIAWQWLMQGMAAQNALNTGAKGKDVNFYEGKIYTLRYFYGYELPKRLGLLKRLKDSDNLTVEMSPDHFMD